MSAGDPPAELRDPVFVVGAMRSGTTLLAKLLGGSPGLVHCPFELKELWSQAGGVPMASARTGDTHCAELGTADMSPGQRERLSTAFVARMRASGAGKRSDAVFLNKNPHLSNKVLLVDALFPTARFVTIHRPLPQVVVSLRALFLDVHRRQGTWHVWPEPGSQECNRCWQAVHDRAALEGLDPTRVFPGGDPTFLAEYWFESNRAVGEALAGIPGGRWHQVSCEEMQGDPRRVVRGCLRFLGEDDPGPASIEGQVDPARKDAWRASVTTEERRAIDGFLARART